ncbi:MAG: HAD family hydrolase, partial [Ruminococcaceae bacterium]|nr:HAD family hydrolase [Oscillospiraceae bacterium]
VAARGLQGYFTELLGLADIYGVSKVQVGRNWLAQSGIDPAACVMVGDTQHDAEVAAALGTGCVLYTGGHQSRKRLEAVCPHVIDDLAQLPQLLETL